MLTILSAPGNGHQRLDATTKEKREAELQSLHQLCGEYRAEIKKHRAQIKEYLYLKALLRNRKISEQRIFRNQIHIQVIANKLGRTIYKKYKQ